MEQNKEVLQKYFEGEVQPVFQKIIIQIIKNRPEDIIQFTLNQFKNTSHDLDSQDDERFDIINKDDFEKLKLQKKKKGLFQRRVGVSSEATGIRLTQQRKPIQMIKTAGKPQKTQMKILFYFMNSFMFQHFTEEEKKLIIDSMVCENTKENQIIIKEGEYGDCMYFVEEGLFECSVMTRQELKPQIKILKNYQSGDFFGQLCLLHNAKRLATVISKTEGLIYSLTRQNYKHINKMSMVKKRNHYLKKIQKISHFSCLHKEDLDKLCDLFTEVTYDAGSYVINEGDVGDKFYIVLEGILIAKSNSHDAYYQCYQENDYFGEVALVTKKYRQLSILAVTNSKLIYATRQIFRRVIDLDKAKDEIESKYRDIRLPLTHARRKRQVVDP